MTGDHARLVALMRHRWLIIQRAESMLPTKYKCKAIRRRARGHACGAQALSLTCHWHGDACSVHHRGDRRLLLAAPA